MKAAILDLAGKRSVSGMAAQIVRCGQINQMLGTDLRPWELDQIPDEWMTAFEVWIDGVPKARAWQGQIDEAMKRLRSRRVQ
jgi:hypothetical protein